MNKEICICAAIKLQDGFIIRGHRHADCYHNLAGRPKYKETKMHLFADEGFITSKNRYVGREEGLALQLAADIPSADKDGYRGEMLFIEDLY